MGPQAQTCSRPKGETRRAHVLKRVGKAPQRRPQDPRAASSPFRLRRPPWESRRVTGSNVSLQYCRVGAHPHRSPDRPSPCRLKGEAGRARTAYLVTVSSGQVGGCYCRPRPPGRILFVTYVRIVPSEKVRMLANQTSAVPQTHIRFPTNQLLVLKI